MRFASNSAALAAAIIRCAADEYRQFSILTPLGAVCDQAYWLIAEARRLIHREPVEIIRHLSPIAIALRAQVEARPGGWIVLTFPRSRNVVNIIKP